MEVEQHFQQSFSYIEPHHTLKCKYYLHVPNEKKSEQSSLVAQKLYNNFRGRRSHALIVVEFTTTYVISAYHH